MNQPGPLQVRMKLRRRVGYYQLVLQWFCPRSGVLIATREIGRFGKRVEAECVQTSLRQWKESD